MERSVGTPDDLVSKALSDHRGDFEAFVRARVPADEVDDIVQLAATRAIAAANSLHDDDAVLKWLYQIHRNLIVDSHRKRDADQRHVDHNADVPELAHPISDEGCLCSISQARQLRPSYATILSLVDADGLELAEAARRLNVSKNNATVRLHRARRALRDAMLEHCGVTDRQDCARCRCIEDACCVA